MVETLSPLENLTQSFSFVVTIGSSSLHDVDFGIFVVLKAFASLQKLRLGPY